VPDAAPAHRRNDHAAEATRWHRGRMGRPDAADAETRRRVAVMLRAYGPPLDHFADPLLAAPLDTVRVGRLTGPIDELHLTHWQWRAMGGRLCDAGCVHVGVGVDRLEELAAAGVEVDLQFLGLLWDYRDDGGMLVLELLHDDGSVVAATGHDGPIHAWPADGRAAPPR
jgi:hypothetical protein